MYTYLFIHMNLGYNLVFLSNMVAHIWNSVWLSSTKSSVWVSCYPSSKMKEIFSLAK